MVYGIQILLSQNSIFISKWMVAHIHFSKNIFFNNLKGISTMKLLINKILKTSSLFFLIALIFTAGCQQPKPDPSVELKPIIDKYVEVWNNGNYDELNAIVDSTFLRTVNTQPDVKGLEGIKKAMSALRTAYPDVKIAVDNVLYSENGLAGRWILTGTNTGPGEMPPTGKPVSFWGESIFHISNGKMTREIVAYDNQSLMEQLGFTMMPANGEMK